MHTFRIYNERKSERGFMLDCSKIRAGDIDGVLTEMARRPWGTASGDRYFVVQVDSPHYVSGWLVEAYEPKTNTQFRVIK